MRILRTLRRYSRCPERSQAINTNDELKVEKLLQLCSMENNLSERETKHGDGWLYDHAQCIREYAAEIDALIENDSRDEVKP